MSIDNHNKIVKLMYNVLITSLLISTVLYFLSSQFTDFVMVANGLFPASDQYSFSFSSHVLLYTGGWRVEWGRGDPAGSTSHVLLVVCLSTNGE